MPTAFQNEVIAELRNRTDKHNEVNVTFKEIASALGGDASPGDVHLALIQLKDDGFFPGKPYFDSERFNGRLPS